MLKMNKFTIYRKKTSLFFLFFFLLTHLTDCRSNNCWRVFENPRTKIYTMLYIYVTTLSFHRPGLVSNIFNIFIWMLNIQGRVYIYCTLLFSVHVKPYKICKECYFLHPIFKHAALYCYIITLYCCCTLH